MPGSHVTHVVPVEGSKTKCIYGLSTYVLNCSLRGERESRCSTECKGLKGGMRQPRGMEQRVKRAKRRELTKDLWSARCMGRGRRGGRVRNHLKLNNGGGCWAETKEDAVDDEVCVLLKGKGNPGAKKAPRAGDEPRQLESAIRRWLRSLRGKECRDCGCEVEERF